MTESAIVEDFEHAFDQAAEHIRRMREEIRNVWRLRRAGELNRKDFLEALGFTANTAGLMATETLKLLGSSLERNAISGAALEYVEDERQPGDEG